MSAAEPRTQGVGLPAGALAKVGGNEPGEAQRASADAIEARIPRSAACRPSIREGSPPLAGMDDTGLERRQRERREEADGVNGDRSNARTTGAPCAAWLRFIVALSIVATGPLQTVKTEYGHQYQPIGAGIDVRVGRRR